MFRVAIISIITLRVILCPLLCVGCVEAASALPAVGSVGCYCSDSDREPCRSNEGPSSSPFDRPSDRHPCPCDTGCVCQVTPELNNRTVSADLELSLDFLPVCIDTLDFSEVFASRGEEFSHRLDLERGR